MKLICLNVWGGILYEPFIEFIKQQSADTDIFCFQEMIVSGKAGPMTKHKVRGQLFEEVQSILKDHVGYSRFGALSNVGREILEAGAEIGLSTFMRKNITIVEEGGFLLYSGDIYKNESLGGCTGNFQYVVFESSGERYVVGDVHGMFLEFGENNPHKGDAPERLEQSRRLKEFFRNQEGKKILVGDFNARPETESIAMLSEGMRNLITEYNIETTRSSEYEEMEKYKDYIADYAFVSSDVNVKDFRILPDVISDHLPLILEFS